MERITSFDPRQHMKVANTEWLVMLQLALIWYSGCLRHKVIEQILQQKIIEFNMSSERMLPLDYYSLGYCISHSQCQWVLTLGGIDEEKASLLGAGARTKAEPRGRVVGLHGSGEISTSCINMLLNKWRSILHLHQLCALRATCVLISWQDLSTLRVLELLVDHTKGMLNTLLPYLSLESLTIHVPFSILSPDECVAIADHVTSTTILKELCISAKICDVEPITAALEKHQSLQLERLELEHACKFTVDAGALLTQFIKNTTTLQYLTLKGCKFVAHILLVLARAIHQNSTLQTKLFEDVHIILRHDIEAQYSAQLLAEYPDMTRSIHIKNVRDAGAVAIAEALHGNSTLTLLDLSNNCISGAGVAIAEVLKNNSTLTSLNLSDNKICDTEAVAIVGPSITTLL